MENFQSILAPLASNHLDHCKAYISTLFMRILIWNDRDGGVCKTKSSFQHNGLKVLCVFAQAEPRLLDSQITNLLDLLKKSSQSHETVRATLDLLNHALPGMDKIPAALDEYLLKEITSGGLRVTDSKRFSSPDDVRKALQCLCNLRSLAASNLLERMLQSNVGYLKSYVQNPSIERQSWGQHHTFYHCCVNSDIFFISSKESHHCRRAYKIVDASIWTILKGVSQTCRRTALTELILSFQR